MAFRLTSIVFAISSPVRSQASYICRANYFLRSRDGRPPTLPATCPHRLRAGPGPSGRGIFFPVRRSLFAARRLFFTPWRWIGNRGATVFGLPFSHLATGFFGDLVSFSTHLADLPREPALNRCRQASADERETTFSITRSGEVVSLLTG